MTHMRSFISSQERESESIINPPVQHLLIREPCAKLNFVACAPDSFQTSFTRRSTFFFNSAISRSEFNPTHGLSLAHVKHGRRVCNVTLLTGIIASTNGVVPIARDMISVGGGVL